MYRLYAFFTQNSMKTVYVAEELGIDYEFRYVDLFKGENRTGEFRELTPAGKVPVLQVGNQSLFESGAICRYLANAEQSPLYPAAALERAWVDQWMDYFTCHLGRWLSTLYFETIIKPRAGLGEPDPKSCEEAQNYTGQQMAMVEAWLQKRRYLTGEQLTIADLFAFAYVEQAGPLEISLAGFPNLSRWFESMESRPGVQRAREKVAELRRKSPVNSG